MLKNKQYLYRPFSIVLPVLNEEKNIKKLISLIKKYLKNYKYELIFVDDHTKKIINNYISKNIKYYLRKKIKI